MYIVPRVESIKLMTIIKVKLGQNGRWSKIEMRNFLLNYLRYQDSNKFIIYIECNRFKGSFN